MGWHADDEPLFQGKTRDCRIISLSLGAARSFELRKNWSDEATVHLRLSAGDLCTMAAWRPLGDEMRVVGGHGAEAPAASGASRG